MVDIAADTRFGQESTAVAYDGASVRIDCLLVSSPHGRRVGDEKVRHALGGMGGDVFAGLAMPHVGPCDICPVGCDVGAGNGFAVRNPGLFDGDGRHCQVIYEPERVSRWCDTFTLEIVYSHSLYGRVHGGSRKAPR